MIGIAAIVLSLLFVGLQMKQSQEIAIAAQYQERANAANDVLLTFLETATGEMGSRLFDTTRLHEWPEELVQRLNSTEPAEIERSFLRFSTLMILYDNNLFQFELGFLDEASWLAFRDRMIRVLTLSIASSIYNRGTIIDLDSRLSLIKQSRKLRIERNDLAARALSATALGRKLPLKITRINRLERPLWMKADLQPGTSEKLFLSDCYAPDSRRWDNIGEKVCL